MITLNIDNSELESQLIEFANDQNSDMESVVIKALKNLFGNNVSQQSFYF